MLRLVGLVVAGACLAACSSQSPPLEAASSDAGAAHGDHASMPHGDHSPHYGGTVYMKGDLHFEVVLDRSGTHRVYFSDAARADLPAATASEVTLVVSGGATPTATLTGHIDENGESWIVNGAPVQGPDLTVRVAFVVEGEPYWIDVPFIPGVAVDRASP